MKRHGVFFRAPFRIQALAPLNLSSMDLSLPISVPGGSNKDVVNLSHRNLTANDLLWLSKDLGGSSSHQITTIKLGYNDLRDEGAKIISSLLSQHRSITCLDLGFCQIGDDGIEALCQTLTYNTSLKILYLSGNSITENGCKYLGNALQANKSLDALYLTGNSGKAKGAKYIAKGLKFNQSITKLFLNGNKIEKEGASSISDTLITNHSITHLSLVSSTTCCFLVTICLPVLPRYRATTTLAIVAYYLFLRPWQIIEI